MGTTTNKLNYVNYDWATLYQQLQNVLRTNASWIDVLPSSTGEVLLEFYAYVANMLLYYVERTAEESYLSTAQRKSSLINLVSLLNYQPARNVSATGNVTLTLGTPSVNNIIIPRGTRLTTSGGYYYSTSVDSILFAGQTTILLPVIQGQFTTVTFTATGAVNQEFSIADLQVENGNLSVLIGNTLWNLVSSFVNSVSTSTDYRIISNNDGTISVQTGDNINGVAPAYGTVVTIVYLKSDGLVGNVYSVGAINTIIDPIYDSTGAVVSGLSVTNQSAILGGSNAETIEQIRYNAPRVFSTGDRFVTRYDGINIIGNYPSVASVNVWGEAEQPITDPTLINQVYIAIILQEWVTPNTDFKTGLSSFLYTKAPLTIRFSYLDPVVYTAYPLVTIYALAGYSLSAIQNQVLSVLQEQFELGLTSVIGANIRQSQVSAAIQAVPGVAYCYVTLQVASSLTASYTSGYQFGNTLGLSPLKRGTINVFVDGVLYAQDNGVGGFTSLVSGTTSSGVVTYGSSSVDGVVNVSFSPALSSGASVTVRYQQDLNGDLVVGKNEIVRYANSSINISY